MAIEYEITPLSWENKGTEPPDTLKQSGWQPAQKPASAYFNYEWALVNDCLKELQAKLSDHATLNDQEIAKKLDSSEFTADKIIEVLNTASGSSGGGLNADTLDGKDSAAFAEAAHTHSEFENMVRVEGLEDAPSTGLLIDSDLLEGHPASYFATAERVTPIDLGGTGATSASAAVSNFKTALVDLLYPVGSIHMSVNSANPSTYFGGTWVSWGAGRVPVGVNASDSSFSTVEKTGGEKTHTLTVEEMPSHTHDLVGTNFYLAEGGVAVMVDIDSTASGVNKTSGTGGGAAHNNLQPYITCYMWKRTA